MTVNLFSINREKELRNSVHFLRVYPMAYCSQFKNPVHFCTTHAQTNNKLGTHATSHTITCTRMTHIQKNSSLCVTVLVVIVACVGPRLCVRVVIGIGGAVRQGKLTRDVTHGDSIFAACNLWDVLGKEALLVVAKLHEGFIVGTSLVVGKSPDAGAGAV